jgi:starch synthase
VVSRLTDQKGIDLLPATLPAFLDAGGGLVVLGSGDPVLEGAMRDLALRYPGRVGLRIGYDEALSHLIQAGSDAILVPSRFEPCGLTQMYALRYGAIPVVARVGGLADTVIDANEAAIRAEVATGVQFLPATEQVLDEALRRTLSLYANPPVWQRMQRRGMKSDVSWLASAKLYAGLYAKLLGLQRDDQPDN